MYGKIYEHFLFKQHSCGLFAFSVSCYLAYGAMSIPAIAIPQPPAPIEAQVSVAGSKTLSLGEPLSLLYRITNTSNRQGVGIGLGSHKTSWCQFRLTDASGNQVQATSDQQSSDQRGLHSTGIFFLRPDAYEEDHLVVTQALKIAHPGRYTLVVQVNIPYTTEEATEENFLTSNLEGDIKSSDTVLKRRFVFPITVTEMNVSHLEAQANDLKRMVLTEKNDKKKQALLNALFSIPEAQASASWRDLINGVGNGDTTLLADRFARLHSSTGAELLVQLLDKPGLSSSDASFIQGKIFENYETGPIAVKERIKALAVSRGSVMPEGVIVPQATD